MTPPELEALIRRIDLLETSAEGYLSLMVAQSETDPASVEAAIASGVLLVDRRRQVRPDSCEIVDAYVCRLNRHHPNVRGVLASDAA